ncbi:hypothetical protein Tco_0663492 [Tanacetum coccineum]
MDSCWTCGNPFHSYENCPKEKASREERVLETYDYQYQYDYYEHDTYHVDYSNGMKDYTMYRGDYDDQYYHPAYESPSFFNQPQRSTQQYYYQGQRQDDKNLYNLDQKLDKLMSMIESKKEENQRALKTEVGRLAEQLNREEPYEPQGITVLDFDDEDEGEEKNEEFTLHSTNTIEWSSFGSYKDKEDADDHNNSFEDLILPIKEHGEESVPFKVGEEVMEANTTPYLPTLKEPILSPIDDIRSKEDEDFWLFRYIKMNVGMDDISYTKFKARVKVSFIEDHHVVERCHENSFSKVTHIIVKQVHRKARVGVRKQRLSLCHGKREFQEALNSGKLITFASKKPQEKHVRIASNQRKRKIKVWVSNQRRFLNVHDGGVLEVLTNENRTWTRRTRSYIGNSEGKCSIKPP